MAWPYHILELSKDQKQQRRILLERYGLYAQLSTLVPILIYQLYRLGVWVYLSQKRKPAITYSAIPQSSSLIATQSKDAISGDLARKWRATVWWLESELAPNWGFRGLWISGGIWTLWSLFLCFNETGQDYIHVAKRFGIVAAAQFPLHYMLSMKCHYSPLAFVFNTSHKQLNPWHQLLGRVIYFLLLLHTTWYLNYFIQAGVLQHLWDLPSITGIASFTLLTVLATTSLERVRRWSYRAFYNSHLAIAFFVLAILFVHTDHLRLYILQALALSVLDRVCRKLNTVTQLGIVTYLPRTNLLKVQIPIAASRLSRFRARPGQHVYLSVPSNANSAAKSSSLFHKFLSNPFSIADISGKEVTLVLRVHDGPTTQALRTLAGIRESKTPIGIEGPYGSFRRLTNLAVEFDRILLVAGGVGGTFIVPMYHALQEQLASEDKGLDRLTLIWSTRSAAEIGWTVDSEDSLPLVQNENVNIYLTRNHSTENPLGDMSSENGSIEMDELQPLSGLVAEGNGHRGRPDLEKIVDETFRCGNEERVAVLFCGPPEMARELKAHVERWVNRGRYVWWYNESFGW